MKIAFIGGTGDEGKGLAYRMALAGHACTIGSRSIERARSAADELRAKAGALEIRGATNADAAAQCELLIITTPYAALADTLPALAASAAGRVAISTVVPMSFEGGRARLVRVEEGSAAEQAQALLPQATVVGAFQNLSAHKLLKAVPLDADVVACADNAEAKREVMTLAEQIEGVRGVDGGALANSQIVEGITALLVSINRTYKTQAGIRIAGI